MDSTEPIKVPFFKKGKLRPTTARRRSVSPSAAPEPLAATTSKSQVVLPSRKTQANLLTAGTKRTIAQRDEEEEQGTREGPGVEWTASGSHVNTALEIIAGDEAEELMEKKNKKASEVPKSMRIGPQRSTNTIRTVTIVDYQPDVCKDYKETGYCGFGDTCKFLHDRGTYLAGWQLDKLADNPKKQAGDASTDSDSDEDIPFACLICRKHYTDPIVTRCGHYFCSACAIKRFARTPKCAACGTPTAGIFNRADKVIEKINRKEDGQDVEDV